MSAYVISPVTRRISHVDDTSVTPRRRAGWHYEGGDGERWSRHGLATEKERDVTLLLRMNTLFIDITDEYRDVIAALYLSRWLSQ